MDFGKLLGDFFMRPQVPTANQEGTFAKASVLDGPISQGFNRVFNDPFANQQKFNEIKARQERATTPGTLANPGAAGAGWISRIGNNLGIAQGIAQVMPKAEKTFETSLTYMKSFEGKSIVLTGGTGGIGSKVAKKLLKAGKPLNHSFQGRE